MQKKTSNPKSMWQLYKRLFPYLSTFKYAFMLGILGNMLYGGVDASFTYILKPVLNQGFVERNQVFIQRIPFIIIGLFVLRFIANFMANYFMVKTGRGVVMAFRQHVFRHLLALPMSYYDSHPSGELLSTIIYNIEQLATACSDAITKCLQSGFMVIGLLIVMLVTSWRLTLIYFSVVPFIAVAVVLTSRGMRRVSHVIQDRFAQLTNIAEEAIECFKVIRIFGGQKREIQQFDAVTKANYLNEIKLIVLRTISVSSVQMLAAIALASIIYLATLPNSVTTLSVGAFVALIAAMLAMLKPMKQLTNINGDLQKGLAALQSVYELLDQEQEQETGSQSLTRVKGRVSYEHVSFAYTQDARAILSDISFTIAPSQMIALVGPSGAGKSTCVNLLSRFYPISAGKIYLDGIDITTVKLASVREQISLVSQNIMLFNDTIANNIAYGMIDKVSRSQIIHAAKQAQAFDFIEQCQDGFDTIVGENGVLLSGGQRQRLAIARAILKDAPILILDEATSALDTASERAIQSALETLMAKRTTLVIAHRLSTIEKADQILVMVDGQIIERGTHPQLLAADGYYANMQRNQGHEHKDETTILS